MVCTHIIFFMPSFSAHVPTMLAAIIVSSLMMAASLAVVGWRRRRDGLGHWAAALLVNAVGHLLLMLRGQIPDALSIVVGNGLLSVVVAGLTVAIYRFHGRDLPWPWLVIPPVLAAGGAIAFIESYPARVVLVGLVLGLQSAWALVATLQRRHAIVGRGWCLLAAGLGLEAVMLLGRSLAALALQEAESSLLQSSGLQTVMFLATLTVVLVSSVGFVFMSRDRDDESNRVLAAMDPLTGVANRRSLIAALDRDVGRALRSRDSIAVMMVDIDHFKHVNDEYGHPAGDQVLCSVVNVLRDRVRSQDLVGRYGGEEFMVVLPDTTLVGAEQLARELCRAVEESRCPVRGPRGNLVAEIAVTVSIGVFGGRLESGDSWDMLIAAADRALYQAKENGRNRVEVATHLRRTGVSPATLAGAETSPGQE